jgi:hypothetical protein
LALLAFRPKSKAQNKTIETKANLGNFLEGSPDLHLDVQDTVADEEMHERPIQQGFRRGAPFGRLYA